MNRKFLAASLFFPLLLSACNTDNLQGRFDKVSDTKSVSPSTKSTTSTPSTKKSTLMSIEAADHSLRTINISEVDFDYEYDESNEMDTDPTWYSIGQYNIKYSSGVKNCGTDDVGISLTNANSSNTTNQYQDHSNELFQNIRLQFRDKNDKFLGYVYASDSNLNSFDTNTAYNYDSTQKKYVPTSLSLSGSNYFYVEAQPSETPNSSYMNRDEYLYLSSMCVSKGGETYLWMSDDGNGENSYFSAVADFTSGILSGGANVQE